MLKANPRLLDSTAYEDPVIRKSVHLEQLWTPETTDHLIEVKKAHPEMSWTKIKEKFFPTRTEKFLSTKWGKILRADPEILQDLTTSRDRGWNPEEEAFLIDIKRSHPLWTWERIQAEKFPKRNYISIRGKWGRMLKVNPKLLGGIVSFGASNVEYGSNVDEDTGHIEVKMKNLKRSREERKRLDRSKKRIAYKRLKAGA
jgi:hypothetical protein